MNRTGDDLDEDDAPRCPLGVLIAGWLWIVLGGVTTATHLGLAILLAGKGAEPRAGCCAAVLAILAVWLFAMGRETVLGESENLRTVGLASLVIALLELGVAALLGNGALESPPPVWSAMTFILSLLAAQGVLFLAAGVLALFGERQYADWRAANRAVESKPAANEDAPDSRTDEPPDS